MEINSYFTIKTISEGTCITIDFSKYSYVMKLCKASGAQDILHSEPETSFSQEGESLLHCIPYEGNLAEMPLVYCDIFCAGICTDKSILINSFADASGNKNWTIFNKKFSTGKTTKNQRFDKICTISDKRIFIDPQFPVGHPKDPFEKSKIERQLSARLKYEASSMDYMEKKYPDQLNSSLCGPAVFFYSLLIDRPEFYCEYIKELWNTGQARLGSMLISPSKDTCNPTNYTDLGGRTLTPAIDWISMASLRDNENIFFDYQSPEDTFSGATLPEGIIKWVKSVGARVIFHEMTLFSWSQDKVINLSNYVNPDNHVAVLINHGLLEGGESGYPTHWIVLTDKFRLISNSLPIDRNAHFDSLVDVEVFSWGDVKKMSEFSVGNALPFKKICSYIYGAVVFTKIP